MRLAPVCLIVHKSRQDDVLDQVKIHLQLDDHHKNVSHHQTPSLHCQKPSVGEWYRCWWVVPPAFSVTLGIRKHEHQSTLCLSLWITWLSLRISLFSSSAIRVVFGYKFLNAEYQTSGVVTIRRQKSYYLPFLASSKASLPYSVALSAAAPSAPASSAASGSTGRFGPPWVTTSYLQCPCRPYGNPLVPGRRSHHMPQWLLNRLTAR